MTFCYYKHLLSLNRVKSNFMCFGIVDFFLILFNVTVHDFYCNVDQRFEKIDETNKIIKNINMKTL